MGLDLGLDSFPEQREHEYPFLKDCPYKGDMVDMAAIFQSR